MTNKIVLEENLQLFPTTRASGSEEADTTSTFVHSLSLPVHGWFRFPAGFSAAWARSVIEQVKASKKERIVLLDPFAGVATAVLAGEESGVQSVGLEAQPFIARVASAKLLWHTEVEGFLSLANRILAKARAYGGGTPKYPTLIQNCYPSATIRKLHSLREAWKEEAEGNIAADLVWLAIAAILRICSPVGTAPWQYILPKKTKSATLAPYEAFRLQVARMASDMLQRQRQGFKPNGVTLVSDSRECVGVGDGNVNLVITSPPYPNNYDYADATRLEMTFFGDVERWGDLQKRARSRLIRSCTQHVSIERVDLKATLLHLEGTSIHEEIHNVSERLERERLRHGGKKDYHLMIAAYFSDMYRVWKSLRRVCKHNSLLCFVVGDSAPYGIHVPAEKWLGELAISAGFRSYRFEKVRDRNVKWKNRKHRVPLQEGRLWVE